MEEKKEFLTTAGLIQKNHSGWSGVKCNTYKKVTTNAQLSYGIHGGLASEQCGVPLYVIRQGQWELGDTGKMVSHLQIAPTILKLLDVPIPKMMKQPPLS